MDLVGCDCIERLNVIGNGAVLAALQPVAANIEEAILRPFAAEHDASLHFVFGLAEFFFRDAAAFNFTEDISDAGQVVFDEVRLA